MSDHRRRLASVFFALALVGLAGCGDDEPDDGDLAAIDETTSTSESTSTTVASSTTSAAGQSDTTVSGSSFDGSTSPVSVPAPDDLGVALLNAVEVGRANGLDQVSFTFEGGLPGYDVSYIDPPVRQDGSGNEVEVEGAAYLQMRFVPASGVDLLETLEPTYTGPNEVEGDTEVVTEVVRTGDFEAHLTWVAGVEEEVPYRIETDPAAGTITFEFAPQ